MHPSSNEDGERRSTRRWGRVLLALALGLPLVWGGLWWPITIDDSFITFRYAEHLAGGAGLVFNPGERVEGFSCPAWVLLLAGAKSLGLPTIATSKVLGLLAAMALPWLLWQLTAGRCRSALVPAVGALWLALIPDLALYAVSGMETLQFAATLGLVLAALARPVATVGRAAWALASLGLLLLSRPECVLLAPALWGCALFGSRPGAPRRVLWGFLPMAVGFLLLRYGYYGAWLPNTYLAKPSPQLFQFRQDPLGGGLARWVDHALTYEGGPIGLWLRIGGLLALPLFALGLYVHRGSSLMRACLVSVLVGSAYLAYAPPDWMPGYRFLLPYLLPAMIPCVLGLDRLLGTDRGIAPSWIPLLALAVWGTLQSAETAKWRLRFEQDRINPALDSRHYADIGHWLRDRAAPGDTVLTYEIGAIGYYSGLRILDHEGLVNREVAGMMHAVGGSMGVRFGWPELAETMREVARACVQQEPRWFLTRSGSGQDLALGQPVPKQAGSEAIQRAILQQFGPRMVLAQRFPLGPDGTDSYLLLRARP